MDTTRFDGMTRHFSRSLTQRATLRGLAAGAIGLSAGSAPLVDEETMAKRRRRKQKKGGKTQKL